jgi:hypothetical protein
MDISQNLKLFIEGGATSLRSGRQRKAWGGAQRNPRLEINNNH